MYTDSLSSMLATENNRENHPILNQIHDILAELHNQEKQPTLCKVPAYCQNKNSDKRIKFSSYKRKTRIFDDNNDVK